MENSENKSKSSIIFPSTINDDSTSRDSENKSNNVSDRKSSDGKETFETTLAIENTAKSPEEMFSKPNKPALKKPQFDNQSFMLSTSNNVMDSLPTNGVLYESYSNELDHTSTISKFNIPPKAQNILGISLGI
jgi:hypothetical protein